MSAEVRTRAGVGNPPDMYKQQGNESINNMIKRDLEKKLALVQFTDHLHSLVLQQQQDINLAMIGRGCYTLKEDYIEDYCVPEASLYAKTEEQKKRCINKFNCATVIPRPSFEIADPVTAGSNDISGNLSTNALPLDAYNSKIETIPMEILSLMFTKTSHN